MLRISDRFDEVVRGYEQVGDPVRVPDLLRLQELTAEACEAMDFDLQPKYTGGSRMQLESGETIKRKSLYALVPAIGADGVIEHNISAAVLKMLERIGRGRLWIDGAYVCGPGTRVGTGGPHIALAMYYWHEPVSVTPPDPWSEVDDLLKREAEKMRSVDYAKLTKAPSEPGRQYVQPVTCDERGYRTELTPDEPLRVKMSKYGTFTISDHLWTVQESSGSPSEPGWTLRAAPPPDPLDQRCQRRDDTTGRRHMTPAQRAAVSAHWSAQLRAKVEASRAAAAESEPSVHYCEVEPWE